MLLIFKVIVTGGAYILNLHLNPHLFSYIVNPYFTGDLVHRNTSFSLDIYLMKFQIHLKFHFVTCYFFVSFLHSITDLYIF